MENPPFDLVSTKTSKTYSPEDPIEYECLGWGVGKETENLELILLNAVNQEFEVRFVGITCIYEPSIAPIFDNDALELAENITV